MVLNETWRISSAPGVVGRYRKDFCRGWMKKPFECLRCAVTQSSGQYATAPNECLRHYGSGAVADWDKFSCWDPARWYVWQFHILFRSPKGFAIDHDNQ